MMLFPKTSTETLPSKNPKNSKNKPETSYVNEKILNNSEVLYITRKVIKCTI